MADVRALLKAKRQEARIAHPLAAYNAAGQLRCAACGTAVKHASAWEGHVGSKAHRLAVARLREAEARREEEERLAKGKRKADGQEEEEDAPMDEESDGERAGTPGASKKRRTDDAQGAVPADFFSDPGRAMPPREPDSDEEDEDGPAAPPAASAAPVDPELAAFQAFINAPTQKSQDSRDNYERATVFAEAELVETDEGLPPQNGDGAIAPPVEELTEEQKRALKEQEERELIMDRIVDEERAQEEADAKVDALRKKLDALKKKREAARQAKAK